MRFGSFAFGCCTLRSRLFFRLVQLQVRLDCRFQTVEIAGNLSESLGKTKVNGAAAEESI